MLFTLWFVSVVVFYKGFGQKEIFQEWYHLIWQWVLIFITGYLFFKERK